MLINDEFLLFLEKQNLDDITEVIDSLDIFIDSIDGLYIEISNKLKKDIDEKNLSNTSIKIKELSYISEHITETQERLNYIKKINDKGLNNTIIFDEVDKQMTDYLKELLSVGVLNEKETLFIKDIRDSRGFTVLQDSGVVSMDNQIYTLNQWYAIVMREKKLPIATNNEELKKNILDNIGIKRENSIISLRELTK